jgi:YD repeat-containing protein
MVGPHGLLIPIRRHENDFYERTICLCGPRAFSDVSSYSYYGIGDANPDAPTQIANGLSTTTFTYDNNGNVTQKTVDGTTTTYVYDYANRLISLGSGGATTTYGYEAFGARVLQTGTSTTNIYPFKWYSIASSTGTGAKYSTTTEYVFNGDTLVSTIDQQLAR